jgi:hypothetical protein
VGNYAAYYDGTNSANPIINGGGNIVAPWFPAQRVVDPLTGYEPVNKPRNGGGTGLVPSPSMQTTDSLQLAYVVGSNPAPGTQACFLVAYDYQGNPWATATFSAQTGSSSELAISAGGSVTTVGTVANGFYYVYAKCVGTGANTVGTIVSLTIYEWIPVIVGYQAGGPVVIGN